MRRNLLTLALILSAFTPAAADETGRYLSDKKVFYEAPEESEVMVVHTSLGYSTVLAFPEKPIMVSAGDSSLIQVEIPKNSKNVLIKPLYTEGETNLFVFTSNGRFNYHVVIGTAQKSDYVIDVAEQYQRIQATHEMNIAIQDLLKIAKNYNALKATGAINNRVFSQKDIFTQSDWEGIRVQLLEVFTWENPHYLILHFDILNLSESSIQLNEKKARVLINGQSFRPHYVLFDTDNVEPDKKVHGWMVLKNTFLAVDNPFALGLGIGGKEHVFD